MLKLATQARLPLIEVTTRDLLNFSDVVHFVTGKRPVLWSSPVEIKENTLYYLSGSKTKDLHHTELYKKLMVAESSLLLVNPPLPHVLPFKAGEVPVPREMMLKFLLAVVTNADKAASLLSSLGGCTLKEAAEAAKLTMARDKSLTAKGLMLTRKTCFQGGRGLTQVDPMQAYYEPPEQLRHWVAKEGPFFLSSKDPRLVPRGILFDGPPGVGKSEAAKWISTQLGVPLYRVDIGAVKNKYVGASEENMLSALSQLDAEEPCIVLFDEIEKVFGSGGEHDGNTTKTLLSQMLWWLAEHRTRVLTVMTTNKLKSLPPELYRSGRIDVGMYFNGLEDTEAMALAEHVLETFGEAGKHVKKESLFKRIQQVVQKNSCATEPPMASHADITKVVLDAVKSKPPTLLLAGKKASS